MDAVFAGRAADAIGLDDVGILGASGAIAQALPRLEERLLALGHDPLSIALMTRTSASSLASRWPAGPPR